MATHANILNVREALGVCKRRILSANDQVLCVQDYAVSLGVSEENSKYLLSDTYAPSVNLLVAEVKSLGGI
jgi:hypothetical protein